MVVPGSVFQTERKGAHPGDVHSEAGLGSQRWRVAPAVGTVLWSRSTGQALLRAEKVCERRHSMGRTLGFGMLVGFMDLCVCISGRCVFSLDSLPQSHFLEGFPWTGFVFGCRCDACVPSYADSTSGSWEPFPHECKGCGFGETLAGSLSASNGIPGRVG